MNIKRKYYRMIEGGFADTQVKAFIKLNTAVQTRWFTFAKLCGAEKIWADHQITGIKLTNEIPAGWKSTPDLPRGYYRPQKQKDCMAAYNEFNALPLKPSGLELASDLNIKPVFLTMSLCYPGFEIIGDQILLSLAEQSEIPDGVIIPAIKMSDFWAMKEVKEAVNYG